MTNQDNIIHFSNQLKEFSRLKDIGVVTVVKGIAGRLCNAIVNDTPVDTGRARSSWALTVGTPSESKPPPLTDDQKRQRDNARKQGLRSPEFFPRPEPPDLSAIDGTQKVFIVSNLEYILPLEEGHSQQRPNGMVRVNVLTLEASIEQEVASLNKVNGPVAAPPPAGTVATTPTK